MRHSQAARHFRRITFDNDQFCYQLNLSQFTLHFRGQCFWSVSETEKVVHSLEQILLKRDKKLYVLDKTSCKVFKAEEGLTLYAAIINTKLCYFFSSIFLKLFPGKSGSEKIVEFE